MLYKNKYLPKGSFSKPFIYSNFVSTVDGKIQVLENWKSYWPIGSKNDHAVLTELRAFSDALVHGSATAKSFNFVRSIQNPDLESIRKSRGVNTNLPYIVISNHPDKDLFENLKNPIGEKTYLLTNQKAKVPKNIGKSVNLVRINRDKVSVKDVVSFLGKLLNAKRILVEGGPTLVGSFLEEGLIDEIFLTITPKIFGGENGKTLTLVENILFPANKIKNLKILSVRKIEDEIFLRYKLLQGGKK